MINEVSLGISGTPVGPGVKPRNLGVREQAAFTAPVPTARGARDGWPSAPTNRRLEALSMHYYLAIWNSKGREEFYSSLCARATKRIADTTYERSKDRESDGICYHRRSG
jgi:hypothetical protein